jgi:hypothetical protein
MPNQGRCDHKNMGPWLLVERYFEGRREKARYVRFCEDCGAREYSTITLN